MTRRETEDGDNERWPKRRRTRRLGSSVSVFFSFIIFDNNYYFITDINCNIRNTRQGEAVTMKRAQTTHLTSFGT
jgi:hypothetical protein